MPRPNPPRKRPRRRTTALVKMPQQARDQDGEETKPPPPQRSARAAVRAGATAAPFDTSEWSRRSLFTMVAVAAVAEVIVNLFGYPQSSKTVTISNFLVVLQPIPLVLACFIAMPLTKMIRHEQRYLRVVETALVGVFIFFVWFFLAVGVGALLGSHSSPTTTNSTSRPTPLPANATDAPTTASPSSAVSRGSSSASPSAGTRTPATVPVQQLTTDAFAALVVIDIAAFAVTPFLYYPVYRRLRLRRPPPPPRTARR